MTILKAWFVEEVELSDKSIGHRQTMMTFDNQTGQWIRPDDRMNVAAQTIWDNMVASLADKEGTLARYLIHPVSLMDYCNNNAALTTNRIAPEKVAEVKDVLIAEAELKESQQIVSES